MIKIKEADYFIADKGYDSKLIREQAKQLGMEAMIPKRSNTKKPAIHFKKKFINQGILLKIYLLD